MLIVDTDLLLLVVDTDLSVPVVDTDLSVPVGFDLLVSVGVRLVVVEMPLFVEARIWMMVLLGVSPRTGQPLMQSKPSMTSFLPAPRQRK